MRRLFILAALVVACHASLAQAIFFSPGGTSPPLGPWYLYWPYEAHFQTPAMPEYPYWGAPQTLPPAMYGWGGGYGGGAQTMPYGQAMGYPNTAPGAASNAYANGPQRQAPPQVQTQPRPFPAPAAAYSNYGYNPALQRR
jgi:hypothetical protein